MDKSSAVDAVMIAVVEASRAPTYFVCLSRFQSPNGAEHSRQAHSGALGRESEGYRCTSVKHLSSSQLRLPGHILSQTQ